MVNCLLEGYIDKNKIYICLKIMTFIRGINNFKYKRNETFKVFSSEFISVDDVEFHGMQ